MRKYLIVFVKRFRIFAFIKHLEENLFSIVRYSIISKIPRQAFYLKDQIVNPEKFRFQHHLEKFDNVLKFMHFISSTSCNFIKRTLTATFKTGLTGRMQEIARWSKEEIRKLPKLCITWKGYNVKYNLALVRVNIIMWTSACRRDEKVHDEWLWYMVMVHGVWLWYMVMVMVHGVWYMVMVYGTWLWCMVHGYGTWLWCMVYSCGLYLKFCGKTFSLGNFVAAYNYTK